MENLWLKETSSNSQTTCSKLLEACKNGDITSVETYLKNGGDANYRGIQNETEWTLLLKASYHGHVHIIKLLINYGAQVDLQNKDGWSALMAASQNGHCKVVKLLHEYGAQVDLQNKYGWSALMVASQNGHHEVVKLLHEYGAQVDLQNNNGISALMLASQDGHCEVIKLLHEYGAQVDLQNNNGQSALKAASLKGHCEVVKLLHEYGAQVDLQKNNGISALMLASENGHCEVVKLLHEYGTQVDLQDINGWSALMIASQNGHCEVVKLLHEYAVQVDLQKNNGTSALILASQDGHCEVIKLLHEYGAQVDLQNNNGQSALTAASMKGHCEVVKLLHEYGAQVNLQNNNGTSALMLASLNGHCEVVKLLHKYGTQVNLQEIDGWSTLMIASQNGHCEVVKLLHEYGAQVDQQNNNGWSALMAASENGHCEVVKLLHEYGAQVDLQRNDGTSALMIASEKGHCEVVKLLHEYGAQVDLQRIDGTSALMIASENGHCEVMKLLHEYGAQVDLQENDGSSALMIASENGHCEVVKLLHEYGAQVDLQRNDGTSALMIASENGHCEVVKQLHEYGAQVDLQNNDGTSALMAASLNGHSEVMNFLKSIVLNRSKEVDKTEEQPLTLIENIIDNSLKLASQMGDVEQVESLLIGSIQYSEQEIVDALLLASQNGHNNVVKMIIQRCGHVNSTDDNGRSALIVASQYGHSDVVQTLIQHGAQVDRQDKNGKSSLMLSSENGDKDIVKIILQKEAQVNLINNDGWSALMFASWNCHIETVETLLKHGAHIDLEFVKKLSSSTHLSIIGILNKQIEIDQDQKRHLAAVQEAIDQQGSLTHTAVHGVIVGLARSGKDSLMKRFLGEIPTDKSPSTGVAEKVIQVRVEKSSTIAANVDDSKWTKLTEYDDEAVEMMSQLTAKHKPVKQIESLSSDKETFEREKKQFATRTTKGKEEQSIATFSQVQMKGQASKYPVHTAAEVESADHNLQVQKEIMVTHKLPLNVFKDAIRNKGLEGLRKHLENHWSLYLSNTGGQMEFQELLPFLVSGPSMIFVTFRLDRDLNVYYEIEYEVADKADDSSKHKSFKYTSSATPLETILQTLSTFDAVGTFDYSNQKRERVALTYKVFIIGTHRDILEKSHGQAVASKIKEIDQEIQEAVKDSSYFEHIQFATSDQLIFTVNNFSESDSDFQHIRSSVQRVINTGDFRMITPVHWLIYSLVLRQLKSRNESYDNCFRIARDCGITSHEEHKEALHFIHTKMGLIRYFPQDDLDQVVFLDPQALFDKVTELITDTFTFEKAGKHIENEFKKGIFSFSDLEKHQCSDPLLNPSRFSKVLENLRIAAPFHQDGVLKYFLPCAIPHADTPQEESTQTSQHPIPPLVVYFECGYRPMGLAGALIKYLMTNERQSKDFTWRLSTDGIFRDQVSFLIKQSCDRVVLKMFPTHLEVTFLPDPNDSDRVGYSIEKVCNEVWKTIQAGIERVNSDINYIRNTDPSFTFYCKVQGCEFSKPHPAEFCLGKLFCSKCQESCKLPNGYKMWMLDMLQKKDSIPHGLRNSGQDTDMKCNISHHALLFTQLSEHAAKWRDIGTCLGFRPGELENIQASPNNLNGAPKSWLCAVLAEWLEWAPGDARGSKKHASLKALKRTLKEAGLGRAAEELTLLN